MQVIAQANETILKILNNFKKSDTKNRMMHFCVAEQVEDGVLLFNLFTREMVHLTAEEYSQYTELQYLKDRWFVVPEATNEKAYVDFVRAFLKKQDKSAGTITGYTIFPTTDCNARCFYCFELGRSRIPMSKETAEKTVQYIKNHCGGKKVSISWFGGEPLYNSEAIDVICEGLRREGVEFKSAMVSNAYLFDDAVVEKAVNIWNVQKIQVTLDGTEQTYNRIKAYIYREGNPYQTVLQNVEKLLDASIKVAIRLNMDMNNVQDLLHLVDELAERFGGRENLAVYAHHIFKNEQALADTYSAEEWKIREEAMCQLEKKIAEGNLMFRSGITHNLKLNHCMADSGKNVTILPDGNVGLCEAYSESEFIGHIDKDGFDADVVASWREKVPEIPECMQCFYYPECVFLKKCSSQNVCFLQYREGRMRFTVQRMRNEYENWKMGKKVEKWW